MQLVFLTIWLLLIQFDAIRNLRIVIVHRRSPVYWKTTVLRILVGLAFNAAFYQVFTLREHILAGICQAFVYALPFDLSMALPRIKEAPIMHMGTKSLPERLLAGKNIVWLWVKVWLFVTGILILYYDQIRTS